MNIWDVWVWAKDRGVTRKEFKESYFRSLKKCMHALCTAIFREDKWGASSLIHVNGGTRIKFGDSPYIHCIVVKFLPFGRIKLSENLYFKEDGVETNISTCHLFCNAFRKSLAENPISSSVEKILDDFQNSFANLVLNNMLGAISPNISSAPEPAFQGHSYYPFPALRVGPSPEMVEACSHITGEDIQLPVFLINDAVFSSHMHRTEQEARLLWSGNRGVADGRPHLIVHPWQLSLSDVVRALIAEGQLLRVGSVLGTPLASQRTIRLRDSGYDVKLPINATITGEHRLIYRKNLEYSRITSHIAINYAKNFAPGRLGFQVDTSTLGHRNEVLGQHVCMIVREPLVVRPGEQIVPAVNIFSTPQAFADFISLSEVAIDPQVFLKNYLHVLLTAGIYSFAKLRLGIEPHLQNTLIVVSQGAPIKVIIRDLDSVILDKSFDYSSVAPDYSKNSIDLSAMPDFVEAERRLLYSMLYGNISQAIFCGEEAFDLEIASLTSAMNDALSEASEAMHDAEIALAKSLLSGALVVKDILISRIARDMKVRWSEDRRPLGGSIDLTHS